MPGMAPGQDQVLWCGSALGPDVEPVPVDGLIAMVADVPGPVEQLVVVILWVDPGLSSCLPLYLDIDEVVVVGLTVIESNGIIHLSLNGRAVTLLYGWGIFALYGRDVS